MRSARLLEASVNSLAGEPVQIGTSSEHGLELLGDAREHFLDGRVVAQERRRHRRPRGGHAAHARRDVVRDPLHEVRRVALVDLAHALVHVARRHLAAEDRRRGQIAAAARVAGAHHVLRVELLRGQLRHRVLPERAVRAVRQRRVARQEEVQTRERNQVHRQLPQIAVQLTGVPQTRRDPRHRARDQLVHVRERRRLDVQRLRADLVQRLVVQNHHLVHVLQQLVHRQRRVVRLRHRVRHVRRREHRVRHHHAVRELLLDLRQQQRAHTRTRASSQRVRQLEALQAFARLRFATENIHHLVHQLGSLRVVTLCPVVASAVLGKDEIVRLEQLTHFSGANSIHRSGFPKIKREGETNTNR